MATTWPASDAVTGATMAASHYDSDHAISTGRVQQLIDMILCGLQTSFSMEFGAQTTQSGTYADLASLTIQVPDWAATTMNTLVVPVEAYMDANGGDVRLKDEDSADTGTAVAVDNTGSYADKTLELSIGSTWGDTDRTIIVQGKVDNASVDTLTCRATKVRARFED